MRGVTLIRPLVLISGADQWNPPPRIELAAQLADLDFAADEGALAERIPDADVLFSWDNALVAGAWGGAKRLRWIQSASAGVDSLLFPQLVDSEVVVTNARGVFDEGIAEWALGAMLALSAEIAGSVRRQVERRWEHRATEPLAGSRLLVVGPGPIGRACARLGRAVGMRVAAVGRSARTDGDFERVWAVADLRAAVAEAEWVLDALPLTPETRHLFDASVFEAIGPRARFLNVGRGCTVDEAALVDALRSGRLAGAALDVFEVEPLPPESPLWEMDNVIVSPHMSGDREGWEGAVVELFADNLGRYLRGEPLRNIVDKDLGFGAPHTRD